MRSLTVLRLNTIFPVVDLVLLNVFGERAIIIGGCHSVDFACVGDGLEALNGEIVLAKRQVQ